MTRNKERWAEALAVERVDGDHAPLHVASRIGAVAAACDADGMKRWIEIARQLDALRAASGVGLGT